MPRVRITEDTLYKYEELSDKAKEKAIEVHSEFAADYGWWECTYEDIVRVGSILGIDIDDRPFKTMGGTIRTEPNIYFTLDRGRGISFNAWYHQRDDIDIKIKEYAGIDKVLHGIADDLIEAQRLCLNTANARITQVGRDNGIHINVEFDVDNYDTSSFLAKEEDIVEKIESAIKEFADWAIDSLQTEYDYLTSREAIEESLIANECEFYESGRAA